MPLNELIPGLTDAELASFRVNALRQIDLGGKRQAAAIDILPVIDEEIGVRAARQPPPAPRRRRAKAEPASVET
ncbi:hypothetical protein [Phenylobacterium sp.]|uniref:hypothetical protein n=1 Tax=Phenylobacterium sp. TaxID=1871053 RepID=UPI00289D76B9|nr:hypothetical protein [Phenylobacterium sp.]